MAIIRAIAWVCGAFSRARGWRRAVLHCNTLGAAPAPVVWTDCDDFTIIDGEMLRLVRLYLVAHEQRTGVTW